MNRYGRIVELISQILSDLITRQANGGVSRYRCALSRSSWKRCSRVPETTGTSRPFRNLLRVASPAAQLTKRARLDGDGEKVSLKARAGTDLGEPGSSGGLRERRCFYEYWPILRTCLPLSVNHEAEKFALKEFGSANVGQFEVTLLRASRW